MSGFRRLVYVSGAPGSGKTSLAVPLAAELGYALLTKDRIKETLHDALGAPEPDLAWSRRLGGAAMELLRALAANAPAVVIEANFRPYSDYERAKLSTLAARPVEVLFATRARARFLGLGLGLVGVGFHVQVGHCDGPAHVAAGVVVDPQRVCSGTEPYVRAKGTAVA